MERFQYIRPESVGHALSLLNEPGVRSRPLAGGTDLLIILRSGEAICDRVIDISRLPELHQISQRNGWVEIGAAATFREVIESPLVTGSAPLLAQACRQVGAVQIRNIGTLGGNLANAAACADSLPALVCLEAEVRYQTPDGMQEMPVSDFVLKPNQTALPQGGLIVSIRYPLPPEGSRSVFLKLGRRNAMAISRLTVAALGRLDASGRITDARLVPGAATPRTLRFTVVENLLVDQQPSKELFQTAGQMAVEEMRRITGQRWSSEYKEPALRVMVQRALLAIFSGSQN